MASRKPSKKTKRLVKLVSKRVLNEVAKLMVPLELLVRENEQLRAQVEGLESYLAEHDMAGPELIGAGAVRPDDYFDVDLSIDSKLLN